MAEAEAKEEKQEAAPPKKGGVLKLALIIGGIVVLLAAIGVPVVLVTTQGGAPKEGAEELSIDAAEESHGEKKLHEASSMEAEELEEGEEALGAIFPLDTFVVNLSKGKFVRVQVQFEFVEKDVPSRFHSRLVPIRDSVIALLAAKTADDLSAAEGIETLKGDIKSRVNEVMRKELVKNVYFTQFVIQ